MDVLTVSAEYVLGPAEDMQKHDFVYATITNADEKLGIGTFFSQCCSSVSARVWIYPLAWYFATE
jgi:hypothetical protein